MWSPLVGCPVTQNPKLPAGSLPLTYILFPGLHIKGFLISDWRASQEQGGGDTGGLLQTADKTDSSLSGCAQGPGLGSHAATGPWGLVLRV